MLYMNKIFTIMKHLFLFASALLGFKHYTPQVSMLLHADQLVNSKKNTFKKRRYLLKRILKTEQLVFSDMVGFKKQ